MSNLYLNRKECIICFSPLDNDIFYCEKNIPISFSPTNKSKEEDIFTELNWLECKNCGCIQLHNLIDPNILYNSAHNQTQLTKTWNEHHLLFSSFIDNISNKTVIEIGGSDGYLRKLCLEISKNTNYYISDFSSNDHFTIPLNIEDESTFNCIPNKVDVIIMSHTLEHLYNPRKAIENINKLNCETIFISVPWMEELLKEKSLSIIHIEHTFFLYKSHIKYILESSGYTIVKQTDFKTHSFFIKAEKNKNNIENIKIPHESSLNLKNYFEERKKMLTSYKITKPTILVPGGHFSSIYYLYLTQDEKNNILFCIDNDKMKQNNRIYGTNCIVYSFEEAKKYIEMNKNIIDIIIINCPYKEELEKQILNTFTLHNINLISLKFV